MARKRLQGEFEIDGFQKPGDVFGGTLLKGNPKGKRPLDSKLPIHLVLRANRGGMRRPLAYGVVSDIVYGVAKRYGIKVYKFANAGNHLHLLIKIPWREAWAMNS